MKCLSQNCEKHKLTKKSVTALALLICFISVSLLSVVFILIHADHVHDHNGVGGTCVACAQISDASNTLRQFIITASCVFALLAERHAASNNYKNIRYDMAVFMPVRAKIRMNN